MSVNDRELDSCRNPKRGFRFRLRSLFLLVGLCAVIFGVIAYKRNQFAIQHRLLQNLERTTMISVETEEGRPKWMRPFVPADQFLRVNTIHTVVQARDQDLAAIAGISSVDHLFFTSSRKITDKGVLACREIAGVRFFDLAETSVQGSTFDKLSFLPTLRKLDLSDTLVNDSNLTFLPQCQRLGRLHLTRTLVTDSGMIHVARAPQLEYSDLRDTEVSMRGLQHLNESKSLERVNIERDRLSEEESAMILDHPNRFRFAVVLCQTYRSEEESLP